MLENHADVFPRLAKLRLGQLRHVLPIYKDFARRRRLEHIDAAHQRGFPRAGLPDDTENLAVSDGQIDIRKRRDVAVVAFMNMLQLNHVSRPPFLQ